MSDYPHYLYVFSCPEQGRFRIGHTNRIETYRDDNGRLIYGGLEALHEPALTVDSEGSFFLTGPKVEMIALERKLKGYLKYFSFTNWTEENSKPEQGATKWFDINALEETKVWFQDKVNSQKKIKFTQGINRTRLQEYQDRMKELLDPFNMARDLAAISDSERFKFWFGFIVWAKESHNEAIHYPDNKVLGLSFKRSAFAQDDAIGLDVLKNKFEQLGTLTFDNGEKHPMAELQEHDTAVHIYISESALDYIARCDGLFGKESDVMRNCLAAF